MLSYRKFLFSITEQAEKIAKEIILISVTFELLDFIIFYVI